MAESISLPRTSDPVDRRDFARPVEDPMAAVDAFLQRSRKEADDSIKALSEEAEALRARLAKVEAALGRWQGVAGSLNSDPGDPHLVPGPAAEPGIIITPVEQPRAEEPNLAPAIPGQPAGAPAPGLILTPSNPEIPAPR